MEKRLRAILLVTFATALIGVNYAVTRKFGFPTGDTAIWFHAGLLMLIIGTYWTEHFFTKPADVVINALVVLIAASTLDNPPHEVWWRALSWLSAALIVLGLIVVWLGTPALPEFDTSRVKKLLYGVIVRVGSSKVLFSFVFLLALLSYFDLRKPEAKLMAAFWGVVLLAQHIELDSIIGQIISLRRMRKPSIVGTLTRVSDPSIVRFAILDRKTCTKGAFVALSQNGMVSDDCPVGIVTGYRRSAGTLEGEALLLQSTFAQQSVDHRRLVIGLDASEREKLTNNAIGERLNSLIGFAVRNTSIARIHFELIKRSQIEEGHLVSVKIPPNHEVMYQVVDGRVFDEQTIELSDRAYTIGEAEQVGTWNQAHQGFETFSWVSGENAAVFHISENYEPAISAKENQFTIGHVPNSRFPVNIRLHNLVLFHSAILGVTGSGKSFLAFQLIEQSASSGIKVLCLDVTGDYKRYLRNCVVLKNNGAVKEFLDGTEYMIGVVEFSEERVHPITATHMIAQTALKWCVDNRTADEIKEPKPKVLLVLEEAHLLIPEWNSNPAREHQDTVNKTSQVALQARKYGLGLMVITQRTANVTKSILNQCNSIVAFQAYDETGFEFMKNYMGDRYVRALPNLKKRQAVLVGKASVSDRPIIVRLSDQNRDTTETPPPELPKPPAVAAQAAESAPPEKAEL